MPHMTPVDHKVKHKSTIPANFGTEIELFVREYKTQDPAAPPSRSSCFTAGAFRPSPAATSCFLRTAALRTRTPATAGRRP